MSSTDILLHNNCTVSSFNFAIFLKQKIKEIHLNCAINLRSTEMAHTCFSFFQEGFMKPQ